MLSEDARRQIEEHERRRSAWVRGEAPLVDGRFGSRAYGAITEITPGCEIWSVEDGRRNWHNEPLGGIVLHVDSGHTTHDQDTGEIVEHGPRYRCYDPLTGTLHNAFCWLDESQVNREAIQVSPGSSLVIAIRRFCREVGKGPRTLSGSDAQLVTDAHRLTTVLMGGGTHT